MFHMDPKIHTNLVISYIVYSNDHCSSVSLRSAVGRNSIKTLDCAVVGKKTFCYTGCLDKAEPQENWPVKLMPTLFCVTSQYND